MWEQQSGTIKCSFCYSIQARQSMLQFTNKMTGPDEDRKV